MKNMYYVERFMGYRYYNAELGTEKELFAYAEKLANYNYQNYIEEALKKYIDVAEELDYALRNEFKDYELDFFKYLEINLNRDYKLSDKIDDFLLEKEEDYKRLKFRTIDNEIIPIEKYDLAMKKANEICITKVDELINSTLKNEKLRISDGDIVVCYYHSLGYELTNPDKYTSQGALSVNNARWYFDDLKNLCQIGGVDNAYLECFPCIADEYNFEEMETPKDMYFESGYKDNNFTEYLGKMSLVEAVEKAQGLCSYCEHYDRLEVEYDFDCKNPLGELEENESLDCDCVSILEWAKATENCKEEKSKSKGWCY